MGFQIDFNSDNGCTFSGTLKSFVILHNIIKNSVKLKSRTLLEFRAHRSEQSDVDKSVMCDLLKPYISLRGRQPRCSLKASEMGFVNDIDLYLQTDAAQNSGDNEYGKNTGGEGLRYKRRRKRGRPSKEVKGQTQKVKLKYSPGLSDVLDIHSEVDEDKQMFSQKAHQNSGTVAVNESEMVEESFPEYENKQSVVIVGESELMDPFQQRLLEEQVKCQKIMGQKGRQQTTVGFDVDDGGVSSVLAAASHTDKGDDPQNSSDACIGIYSQFIKLYVN